MPERRQPPAAPQHPRGLGRTGDLGRVTADADIGTLAPTLIGAGHLLYADRSTAPPEAGAVHRMVTTVLAGVIRTAGPPEPGPAAPVSP